MNEETDREKRLAIPVPNEASPWTPAGSLLICKMRFWLTPPKCREWGRWWDWEDQRKWGGGCHPALGEDPGETSTWEIFNTKPLRGDYKKSDQKDGVRVWRIQHCRKQGETATRSIFFFNWMMKPLCVYTANERMNVERVVDSRCLTVTEGGYR